MALAILFKILLVYCELFLFIFSGSKKDHLESFENQSDQKCMFTIYLDTYVAQTFLTVL